MDQKTEISKEEKEEGIAEMNQKEISPEDQKTAKKPTKQSSKKRRKNKMLLEAEALEKKEMATSSDIPEDAKPALSKKILTPLESSINKSCVLLAQHVYIEKTQALNNKNVNFSAKNRAVNNTRSGFTFTYPTSWNFPNLDPSNKVDINTLVYKHDEKLNGKFLLCRTIAPAVCLDGVIIAAVEDEGMNHAVRLAIRFFSPEAVLKDTNFDMVLPPGAFLVVNNPWFYRAPKGSLLKCDNPFEVEMISMKALSKKFPESPWISLKMCDEQKAFSALNSWGDKAFVFKRYMDALRWYNLALDYVSKEEDKLNTLINKTGVLIALGCYQSAVNTADDALDIDAFSIRAICKKAEALGAQEMYDEALEDLEDRVMANPLLSGSQQLMELRATLNGKASY